MQLMWIAGGAHQEIFSYSAHLSPRGMSKLCMASGSARPGPPESDRGKQREDPTAVGIRFLTPIIFGYTSITVTRPSGI